MNNIIQFIPCSTLDAKSNLHNFVSWAKTIQPPFGVETNRFDDDAWSISALIKKGGSNKFIYFGELGFNARVQANRKRDGSPAVVPEDRRLPEPFRSFAKGLLQYLHLQHKTTSVPGRLISLRYLAAALYEVNDSTCPTAVTPEVMNRALALAIEGQGTHWAYAIGVHLTTSYRVMVELELVAVQSEWSSHLRIPRMGLNRVGQQFEKGRQTKLPSPLALEALAAIFNAETNSSTEILASSLCALMLCSPDRAIEALYAPLDILIGDWTDPDNGELGTGLRWYPAKGGTPVVKTVIPSMRNVAIRAVENLRRLSDPARKLALWYEHNPDRMFLPPYLEHLRARDQIDGREVYSILFADKPEHEYSPVHSNRTLKWLDAHDVCRTSGKGGTSVAFADLEQAVLAALPAGFPIMDRETKMRYSEALCIARVGEFKNSDPSQASFARISYDTLKKILRSTKNSKSIFEKRGFRDADGEFLSLSSHMLRHYLNTMVRRSGKLTEDEIAKWSGRKSVQQNWTYNHESGRDVIAKLRDAVGDSSRSVGPFSDIDNRTFVRRETFANIKIITAHTSEFGYCVHDYSQTPCQVHQDCINCDEQVCIKGDQRAEGNLRRMQMETTQLQKSAEMAFSREELGAAEWFKHQTLTLGRINELVAILDDSDVPDGAVIQLSGVSPPSRLAMAEIARSRNPNPVGQRITSIDEIHAILGSSTYRMNGETDAD